MTETITRNSLDRPPEFERRVYVRRSPEVAVQIAIGTIISIALGFAFGLYVASQIVGAAR